MNFSKKFINDTNQEIPLFSFNILKKLRAKEVLLDFIENHFIFLKSTRT